MIYFYLCVCVILLWEGLPSEEGRAYKTLGTVVIDLT